MKHALFLFVICRMLAPAFAGEPAVLDSAKQNAAVSGFASMEFGQIVRGYHKEAPVDHYWLQRALTNISFFSSLNTWLRVYCGLEGELWGSFYQTPGAPETQQLYYSPYIDRAEGVVTLGKNNARFEIGAGCFPFKYNPDARNLGEYLMRGDPYPTYVPTTFDYACTRLLGFRIHHEMFGMVRQDLLLTSATDHYPLYDFALSYLAAVRVHPAVTLGAGVCLDHLLAVNDSMTDKMFRYAQGVDTVDYTFRGTKVMARLSCDPKKFFASNGLFGENDLVLYAEAAILGMANYAGFYSDWGRRMPVMLGFNFPAFNLLTMAAVEAEWWSGPYPNSLYQVAKYNQPIPVIRAGSSKDYWKWSVYLRRDFGPFAIIAQAANDHMRTRSLRENDQDYEQALREKSWYWMLKLRFGF